MDRVTSLLPAKASATVYLTVGILAGAMLLVELLVTRLFSALLFYHYSFFAVSIVMTGLTVGGLLSALLLRGANDDSVRHWHLPVAAIIFSVGSVTATFFFKFFAHWTNVDHWSGNDTTDWLKIGSLACAYLPGLTAAGYFLGSAFAWWKQDISRLYAWDLVAAGAAVALAIFVMRIWQGPAAMLVPSLGGLISALLLSRGILRWVAAILTVALMIPVIWAPFLERPLIPLAVTPSIRGGEEAVLYERWNEHSRVLTYGSKEDAAVWMIIDKDAGTSSLKLPDRETGEPSPLGDDFRKGPVSAFFHLGRELKDVAVIGVGGGKDVVEAIANDAKRVDGYELNAIFRSLLEEELYEYTGGLIDWPEFKFIHDEGRVGIASGDQRYDLIMATLIDTWAATASGGFVLSENSLYTVEGWQEFLEALKPGGILAMTRWYVPAEPAELQRLVALASEALERSGIKNPSKHIIVFAVATESQLVTKDPNLHFTASVLVSKQAFTNQEIEKLKQFGTFSPHPFTLRYPRENADDWMEMLINPETRNQFISQSQFNIKPPNDAAPYFFLMLRATDLPALFLEETSGMRAITYMGVRVLVVMTVLSIVFAVSIWLLSHFAFADQSNYTDKPLLGIMSIYFLCIGFGYILVQLGLLQRLILLLGHPTYAFTVILFSMLLSTGLGSEFSHRFQIKQFQLAWGLVLGGLLLLVVVYPSYSVLEEIQSRVLRVILCGFPPAFAGFLLGFCFPIGVRLISRTGESAIQRMWAINGAAGVAGSAAAAFIGVLAGSHMVIITGSLCYIGMMAAGLIALRRYQQDSHSPISDTPHDTEASEPR